MLDANAVELMWNLMPSPDVYTSSFAMYDLQRTARQYSAFTANDRIMLRSALEKHTGSFDLPSFKLSNVAKEKTEELIKLLKENSPDVGRVKQLLSDIDKECQRYAKVEAGRIRPLIRRLCYLAVALAVGFDPHGTGQAIMATHGALKGSALVQQVHGADAQSWLAAAIMIVVAAVAAWMVAKLLDYIFGAATGRAEAVQAMQKPAPEPGHS